LISRRGLLKGLAAFVLGGTGLGGYAFAIEPRRLSVTRYSITPAGWPPGLKLRLVALADLHVCEPWMPVSRVQEIVQVANSLAPDVTLMLGDFVHGPRMLHQIVPPDIWAAELGKLRAPHGVHAVLGNHDWWDDSAVQTAFKGVPRVRRTLEGAGIKVHENDAVRFTKGGQPFWIAGLGDQWAYYRRRNRRTGHRYDGVDDVPAMLAKVTDDAPVIMMAHEPDVFAELPKRVALQLSGHTHGGQIQFFGYAPVVPSRFGRRYVYGHVVQDDRHLVVSGGIGCSGLPMRFGRPPEIVVVDLGS
jgi:uncharacterized protein